MVSIVMLAVPAGGWGTDVRIQSVARQRANDKGLFRKSWPQWT